MDGEPTLVIYYFTYRDDGSGDPAWLVGQGPIEGDSATATMVFGEGGVFGPGYDPGAVSFTEWGEIGVTWQTCEDVTVQYDGLWGEGSINVGRLTPTMIGANGVCAP